MPEMPGPSAPGGQDPATRTRGSRKAQPSPAVLITLTADPQTLREIEDAFRGFGRRLPHDPRPRQPGRSRGGLQEALAAALAAVADRGWVTKDGDRFGLTDTGRTQADRALSDARDRRDRVHYLLQAPRAARWTMDDGR